jgi:predicted HicB family RNase H-like nuclease
MARKKAEKKPVEAVMTGTKPVRVDLSPDDHRLLRLVAASEGVSMASYARDRLSDLVRVEAKRRGLKS